MINKSKIVLAMGLLITFAQATQAQELPNVTTMIESLEDVWGEAAIRQPDGPSYEFYRDLLPPIRYVNNDFRHYPIMLSAPKAPAKSRWVSNGGSVNARANKKPMWKELGVPVQFLVGSDANFEPFGQNFNNLDGPRYHEGWLPIVKISYQHLRQTIHQEAFAPIRQDLAKHGALAIRFRREQNSSEQIKAQWESSEPWTQDDQGVIRNAQGKGWAVAKPNWSWSAMNRSLNSDEGMMEFHDLLIFSIPLEKNESAPNWDWTTERQTTIEAWKALLDHGIQLEIPEQVVQNAWRALIVGNFMTAVNNRMHYSAGNAYDHLYEAECGDAVRAISLYGHLEEAQSMLGPLLDFQRQATRFHVAGHKLQLLSHHYWITREPEYFRQNKLIWTEVANFIIKNRQSNGLLPKDNYAGDISQQVFSLNSNANCWKGLRDMAVVARELGETASADAWSREAESFRQTILNAVSQSERKDTKPMFIPNALLGDEPAHHPLTSTRMGSYYDLMAPYILGSNIFGHQSQRETAMIEYLRQHGGIAMGMMRSQPHQGEFNKQPGVNALYTLRYWLTLLKRGDRQHAQAGFYGQLAQALTKDTYIGAEGTRFIHGDNQGRSMYLPPNTASNAAFLILLRSLLIQDWDLDNNGTPETLRLLDAIPTRWLADKSTLKIIKAPTAFGPISITVQSQLRKGEITIEVTTPPKSPQTTTIRIEPPRGWKAHKATIDQIATPFDQDARLPLTHKPGKRLIKVEVHPAP